MEKFSPRQEVYIKVMETLPSRLKETLKAIEEIQPCTYQQITKLRECFKMFVENNMGEFEKDFKELTPQERIKTLIELSKMILPKQLEAEVNEVPEPQTITFVMIEIVREIG